MVVRAFVRCENTIELRPMNYEEAVSSDDKEEWIKAVEEEHKNFTKFNVVEAVNIDEIPQEVVVLDTRKANGVRRARNNVRGVKEEPDVQYDERKTSAAVIMIMAGWMARVADVKGAFLLGEFDENDQKNIHKGAKRL